jgi:D-aminopeptidase
MTRLDIAALDYAIAELPASFPGPGGAAAVVKNGEVVVRHAWGFADLENRVPYAPGTFAPICSISKQFTCALLLNIAPDPSVLDPAIAAQLPNLAGPKPTTRDLAHNQSGLRDYWALTTLCGALPEGEFDAEDARLLIGRTRSLHFAPGTRYSYSNGNFRMLATAVAEKAERPFGDMLVERIVRPAGMETAVFVGETWSVPGSPVGYEGIPSTGYRPGVNRVEWIGDAGICATLDDMIAWERFIDATRDDPDGVYRRLSAPVAFADGTPAQYGFGLVRRSRFGRDLTGHGGAIRGWRSQRFHVASERLSVFVVFNHEADAHGAAMRVLAAALGEDDALPPSDANAAAAFVGSWLDEETGLLLDVEADASGLLSASYDGAPELLSVGSDGAARGLDMALFREGDGLRLERSADNLRSRATRVSGTATTDIEGSYRCAELDAVLTIARIGGSWFGGFSGFLGTGAMMPMSPAETDLWRLTCRRSLDAPAPGDWTLRIKRGSDNASERIDIGCWLARSVPFERR